MEKTQGTFGEMVIGTGVLALLIWGAVSLFSGPKTAEEIAQADRKTCHNIVYAISQLNSATVTWADLRPQLELWELYHCERFGNKSLLRSN